jgi:hypothetical protein
LPAVSVALIRNDTNPARAGWPTSARPPLTGTGRHVAPSSKDAATRSDASFGAAAPGWCCTVSTLLDRLGATSRFQAGALAAHRGWL